MTHITCRLTAKNRDQLRNPTLGNRVLASFAFTFSYQIFWRGCLVPPPLLSPEPTTAPSAAVMPLHLATPVREASRAQLTHDEANSASKGERISFRRILLGRHSCYETTIWRIRCIVCWDEIRKVRIDFTSQPVGCDCTFTLPHSNVTNKRLKPFAHVK